MTKKLEILFNLPPTDDQPEPMPEEAAQDLPDTQEQQQVLDRVNTAIDKIDEALPGVRDLERGDEELDELANLARDSAKDLLDLGMQMEARFSGTVFQTAGVLLGHAITAKQAKLDKKLRMVDLQLKKMRLDHQMRQDGGGSETPVEGEGHVMDRNELLAEILNKSR